MDFAHGTHGTVYRSARKAHSAAVARVPGATLPWIYEVRCLLGPGRAIGSNADFNSRWRGVICPPGASRQPQRRRTGPRG